MGGQAERLWDLRRLGSLRGRRRETREQQFVNCVHLVVSDTPWDVAEAIGHCRRQWSPDKKNRLRVVTARVPRSSLSMLSSYPVDEEQEHYNPQQFHCRSPLAVLAFTD